MPKRHLTVQNNINQYEQQSKPSSSKRTRTNDDSETVLAKKSKLEENIADKENRLIEKSPLKPNNETTVVKEPIVMDDTDDSDDDHMAQDYSISSVSDYEQGNDHPTNKQYLIYENVGPKKQTYVVSKTARYWSQRYRKVLRHVYPDAYDMFIHADFSCYGHLEVVENCLLDLTKTIFIVQAPNLPRMNYQRKPDDKVNYVLGFRRLEALTILLDYTDEMSGIDDGDRYYDMIRVIGACYVTILRGLLPNIMFSKLTTVDEILVKKLKKISKQIPNFKQVIEKALTVGYTYLTIADVCSAYTNVLQTVYHNWILVLENISMNLNQNSMNLNDELWKALKHAANIDKNDIEHGDTETFDFMKELRSYKESYGLGGNFHDLSKWTRSDRAEYEYGRLNLFEDFLF